MAKHLIHIIGAALLLNVMVFLFASCGSQKDAKSETLLDQIENDPGKLSEVHDTECYHGGPGSKSCSIPAGVEINGSVSIECSVTCLDGYYACCGLSCTCRPENEQ